MIFGAFGEKDMQSKTNKNLILYLFSIVFFGIFYYFLPFAGDDWAWGSSVGMERLNSFFSGYNGRYVGNLLIILITRSAVAKVVLCSLIMFLLLFILSKIFDDLSDKKNSTANYIIAFSSVLLLVLPNQIAFGDIQPFQIFGSTVGWLSGFTNYVVPAVLILVFYYFVTAKGFESRPVYLLLAFDGLIACLCVEHYTLFCLMFSFGVMAYRYYFNKKICKKSVSFFCGSFMGALIMFSNSSYISMQKGDVSENQRAIGFLGSFKQYASYIFPENASKTLVAVFEIVLLLAVVSLLIFFFIKIYKAVKGRSVSKLLPVICMLVVTLPLLFTNSGKEIYIVAPRCYFLQYFMLVIFIYGKLAKKDKAGKIFGSKKFDYGLKLGFIALLSVTVVLYCRLDHMGMIRDKAVDKALEEGYSAVEIMEYPKSIEHIQWSGNFIKDKTYLKRYQKFKNIPDDKEIVIISND